MQSTQSQPRQRQQLEVHFPSTVFPVGKFLIV